METLNALLKPEKLPPRGALSPPAAKCNRLAFSVWEVLIVLAIIVVLITLFLPATQKVREASSRTVALNNLRQARIAVNGDAPLAAKVVYDANLQLFVNDFEKAEIELARLVKENKGYVAQSGITGAGSQRRLGHWVVRVPVDHFETFMEAAVNLGVRQDTYTDSKSVLDTKDVTEEVDNVESNVKNKKAEEQRLLKHLDKSTGNLQDILAVERELTRVRGEIEQHERRLKILQNQTAMATVTITMDESRSLAFLDNVQTTFRGSLQALVGVGKGVALAAVAATPWLVVVCVFVVPSWPLARRLVRRGKARMGAAS
jgi:hypothetical protein